MSQEDALLSIAIDLTTSLAAHDRYDRLLSAIRRAIPFDAAAVLRLHGDELIPVAVYGLSPEVFGRRFERREHPRLDVVVGSGRPVTFPADSPFPDPFDGLLLADPHALGSVHSCLGCPLLEGNTVIGVLTADALEPGVFDALGEPFLSMLGALSGAAMHAARLIEALEQTSEHHRLVARDLQRDATINGGGDILGTSTVIEHVRREIDLVARSDLTVLITGETGVGKELVARGIHAGSSRRDDPLIYLNCAALPESVAESELFGHTKGAFTGADSHRSGKFEVADGGTLFLDEVGELPLSLQSKLLRVLQEGEIQRVGSDSAIRVNVRILAATNRDLEKEIEAGRFRADLYHRLNMYPLHVPPLRDRQEDIPILAGFFLDYYRRKFGLRPVRLTEESRRTLRLAQWPGNVRELNHLLARAVLRASADGGNEPTTVGSEHLQLGGETIQAPQAQEHLTISSVASPQGRSLREAVDEFKREMIIQAIKRNRGNWAATARDLGMHRSNFHNLVHRLGLRDDQ